jgi:hypothetical protein
MPDKITLSKTKYCKGIQCPKMLWMDINMPEQFDSSVLNETRLETGSRVGDLAMGYFGGFEEVPYSPDKLEMIAKTRQLLDSGTRIIAEASFAYEGNFCSVDILMAVPGGYELIEVKSSTGSASDKPSKVKDIYLDDIAYQVYVLTHSGIKVTKASLLQLNKDYVRKGELDIQKLFVLADCTERVFAMQKNVAGHVAEIAAAAAQTSEPDIEIGRHCDKPYECGYKGWCFAHLPKNNVFEIGWRMYSDKKEEAYRAGVIAFEDVLRSGIELSEKQILQITTAVQNLPPHIDKTSIRDFLSTIKYPLYHLDFETFQQAIPEWDNVSPYSQIPFQYSLHIQNSPCGPVIHKEFLAKEGLDSRRAFAEQLCADIPKNACVIAYHMSFEKGQIKRLATLFPDLADRLMDMHDNMINLAIPFSSGAYYCKEMGGSFSIKAVLPALCPNDPELDYNALDLIHNGSEAMNAYASLTDEPQRTPEKKKKIRAALLAYCRLDTLAMVKILEKLYEAVEE